jgi:hypothetical protein
MLIDKEFIKSSFAEIFEALNSVIWTKKTICSCQDTYGIADPDCFYCSGTGYIETSSIIEADIQELKGDERIAVDAGILNAGDIVVRTTVDNKIKVDDLITHKSKTYQVKYVILDQLEVFIQVGAHKTTSSITQDEAVRLISYNINSGTEVVKLISYSYGGT